MARKQSVSVPFSALKWKIAEVLKDKGFVGEIEKKGKDTQGYLNVALKYEEDGSPRIRDVKRISKPSRRLYKNAKSIRKFKNGLGMTVISTPKGVMSDSDARKANLGGETMFNIW